MKTIAFRLLPGQDLKQALIRVVDEHHIQAGMVLTCVGSLERVALRLAGRDDVRAWEEKMEIVSLVGTLCGDGVHLHIAVANAEGMVFGGHLMEGAKVFTTAEVVVGVLADVRFRREMDHGTGYNELKVEGI